MVKKVSKVAEKPVAEAKAKANPEETPAGKEVSRRDDLEALLPEPLEARSDKDEEVLEQ